MKATLSAAALGVALCVVGCASIDRSQANPDFRSAWKGFYLDLSAEWPCRTEADGETNKRDCSPYYVASERMELTFRGNRVEGGAGGDVVTRTSGQVSKTWELRGYASGDFLMMAYLTTLGNEVPTSPGIGAYVLEKKGNIYVGHIVFRDTDKGIVARCPYVLTKDTALEIASAETKYAEFLKTNAKCERVSFRPVSK